MDIVFNKILHFWEVNSTCLVLPMAWPLWTCMWGFFQWNIVSWKKFISLSIGIKCLLYIFYCHLKRKLFRKIQFKKNHSQSIIKSFILQVVWWLYYLLPLVQPLRGLNNCTNLPTFFFVWVLFFPVLLFFFSPWLPAWCWLSTVLSNNRCFRVTALISACSVSRKAPKWWERGCSKAQHVCYTPWTVSIV